MEFEVRQYQEDAFNNTKAEFGKGKKRVILTMPTGSGKSHVAIKVIKGALDKGSKIGFCVDRLTLLDQITNMIYNEDIRDFGIIQANNPLYRPSENLQIMTSQTLGRRTLQPFDVIIIDECHVVYKSVTKIMKEWENTLFIGLTATPFTRGLGKIWESLVNGTSTADLIKDGFLCNYKAFGFKKPDLKGCKISGGDYNKKDLAKRSRKKELIGDIVENWFQLASDRQTVVGAVDVAHAEEIAEMFKNENVRADVIHCYLPDDEIKYKLKLFKNNEIQILSSVDLISRGFDMPALDCLICARSTKSLNYHLQFLGRGLRPAPNKNHLLILDHAGNIERLGYPDDDFEMKLDMGIKKQQPRVKSEKLPKPCPQCGFLTKSRKCENCGFEKKRRSTVIYKEGELIELQKNNKKTISIEDKDKLYSKLLAGAKAAQFNDGWAAYKFKEKFGIWPARRVEPDQKFFEFLVNIPRNRMMKIIWGLNK